MDVAMANARAGERWVVRHRLPDGSATDVTGWLVRLDDRLVTIEQGDGLHHGIDRVTIIAARRVPPAQGGPDPRRTSAEELERAALPGWLAFSEPLGEWTLRAGGGFTGRANSALAVGDPGVSVTVAASRVIAYAGGHGIAPMAQVIVGSDADSGLVELGWQPVYVTTDVLACRLTTLLGEELPDPRVIMSETLTHGWWEAYQLSRPNRADPAILRMILDGHPPRAFAAAASGGSRYAAISRGHVSGAWLGIAAVWTDPGLRRRGLATAMTRGLGHWAARRGARNAYLQVARENVAAHEAWARLGFVLHHSYRYLGAPA